MFDLLYIRNKLKVLNSKKEQNSNLSINKAPSMCDTGHIWPHYGCHPDNRDSSVGSGATGGSSITDRIHHPTLVTGNLRTAASCCSAA